MEIKAAGNAIDIEALACKVQPRNDAALHFTEIDFLQLHSTTGDEFVLVGGFTFDLKPAIRELMHQRVFTIFGELRPLSLWGDGGGFEYPLPESARQTHGEFVFDQRLP